MSSFRDTMLVVMVVMVVAITAISLGIASNAINDAFQTDNNIPTVAKTSMGNMSSNWGGVFDWIIAAIIIGMPLVSMGLAYFNNVPSIFFWLTIPLLLLMVFVGWGIAASWSTVLVDGGTFAAYAVSDMPITNFILSNFGYYAVLIVLIIAFGTYVKLGQGGAYGY